MSLPLYVTHINFLYLIKRFFSFGIGRSTLPMIWICSIICLNGYAQSFSCDGTFYLSHTASSVSSSTLLSVKQNENNQELKIDTVGVFEGRKIGALGYRVSDNLIYALDQESLELLRINNSGDIEVLTDLSGKLDTTLEYHAGAISPFGNRFYLVARNPQTNEDTELLNVRLTRNDYRVGRSFIRSNQGLRISDIAFSPIYGILYGYDAIQRKLVEISTLNADVFLQNFASGNNPGGIGALFFGKDGFLYGLGGSESGDNTFLRIDPLKGMIGSISSMAGSSVSDGCSCPYQITFEKEITPRVALPCDTISITYRFENLAGTSDFNGIHLRDTLPEQLKIVDIPRLPKISRWEENDFDYIIDIEIQDFLLGLDSAVVRAVVDDGSFVSFQSQAFLDSFPLALGEVIFSDNPRTTPFPDPTSFEVVPLEIQLPDRAFLCGGEVASVTVQPNVNSSIIYEWDHGPSGRRQQFSEAGSYTVSAMSECQLAEASIEVSIPDEKIAIHLPPDTVIDWGNILNVSPNTIPEDSITFLWQSDNPQELICDSCSELTISPITDTRYTLTIQDKFGCRASDQFVVSVVENREIFVPNVFSPNGDGLHDTFYLKGGNNVLFHDFSIYNRWGQEVFFLSSGPLSDPSIGWDGKQNGENVVEGLYFYQAEVIFPDNSKSTFKGALTLLR